MSESRLPTSFMTPGTSSFADFNNITPSALDLLSMTRPPQA